MSLTYHHDVTVIGISDRKMIVNNHGVTIVSFEKSTLLTHIRLLYEMFSHLRSFQYDCVHCFDLDSLLISVLASRWQKNRPLIVYDAHEHFPSLIAYDYFKLPTSFSSILELFIDKVELFFASFCSGFIAVNEYLAKRFSVFRKPLVIVRNIPELSWFDQTPSMEVLADIKFPIVMYVGNLALNKGLRTMMDAKTILDKRGAKTSFVVVGNVKGVSKDELSSRGFVIVDWIDFTRLPSYLRRASVGLSLIKPTFLNYLIAEPNKIFVYMVSSLPIVATDYLGTRIVRAENCGLLVHQDDATEVANSVQTILQNETLGKLLGKNGRLAAELRHNGTLEQSKLTSFYELLETKRGEPP